MASSPAGSAAGADAADSGLAALAAAGALAGFVGAVAPDLEDIAHLPEKVAADLLGAVDALWPTQADRQRIPRPIWQAVVALRRWQQEKGRSDREMQELERDKAERRGNKLTKEQQQKAQSLRLGGHLVRCPRGRIPVIIRPWTEIERLRDWQCGPETLTKLLRELGDLRPDSSRD